MSATQRPSPWWVSAPARTKRGAPIAPKTNGTSSWCCDDDRVRWRSK
jgi:hypothetical protein